MPLPPQYNTPLRSSVNELSKRDGTSGGSHTIISSAGVRAPHLNWRRLLLERSDAPAPRVSSTATNYAPRARTTQGTQHANSTSAEGDISGTMELELDELSRSLDAGHRVGAAPSIEHVEDPNRNPKAGVSIAPGKQHKPMTTDAVKKQLQVLLGSQA